MPGVQLPLKLTAFEEYMLRDDRAEYPMIIVARMHFRGKMDRAAADQALVDVLRRHPLLTSIVRPTKRGSFEWVPHEGAAPQLQWIEGPCPAAASPALSSDLHREPGFTAWVFAEPDRSILLLHVHHVICDGKGVQQVFDDFLTSYANTVTMRQGGGKLVEFAPLDSELLARRGRLGISPVEYLKMLPRQLIGLKGAGQYVLRQPSPLLTEPDSANRAEKKLSSEMVGHVGSDVVDSVAASASAAGVSLNDWLLRDFLISIDEFRARHEQKNRAGWIRIAVPMNLRPKAGWNTSALNAVSMVFIDRTPAQISDPNKLLRSINREMSQIRRNQLGYIFIYSLAFARWLPGGLNKQVTSDRCESTAVLSNIGRGLGDSALPRESGRIVAGNIQLESLEMFSPLRPGTRASAALVFGAKGLNVCMRYDNKTVTAEQANDLMETYLNRIRAGKSTH